MGFSPSIESVQLCLDNYSRLMDDSEKVSDQTSFALRELGLEELVKAWMLYFAYFTNTIKPKSNKGKRIREHINKSGINMEDSNFIDALQSQQTSNNNTFESVLQNLKTPNIDKAFRLHKVKLIYLGYILQNLELILNLFKNTKYKPNYTNYINIIGKYLSLTEPNQITKQEKIDEILEIIKEFDVNKMEELQKKKEEAFYTYLSKDNKIVVPKTRIFDNEGIKKLNNLLYGGLIAAINMLIDV